MSRISFNQFGLVGVDVKSHQPRTAIPYPVITEGNEEQDTYCKGAFARERSDPQQIHPLPSSPSILFTHGNQVNPRQTREVKRSDILPHARHPCLHILLGSSAPRTPTAMRRSTSVCRRSCSECTALLADPGQKISTSMRI